MAKFIFRLQAVLNYKNQLESNLKNKLGQAVKRVENEKKRLNEIIKAKDEYYENYIKETKEGVTVEIIRGYNNYYSSLKKRIEFQKKTINDLQKTVDIIRARMIKVMQEKKMIEKLKEKAFEEFKKEQLIIEQNTSEEIYSYKYIKNTQE